MYIFITIFGILCVLTVICIINAVRLKGNEYHGRPLVSSPKGKEYASHLSKMIQTADVSVRGSNDKTKIYEFHRVLEKLYPLIHSKLEKTDIDGALLFRWKGRNSNEKPILLMSHMDVVEATGSWKYPAFSGKIADGKIWGRGAVDTKGALCAILEAVEQLLSEDFVPYCDVYIASSNNEEITGDGAIKTVEYLYEKGIEFALVMDEGGAVMGSMLGSEGSSAMVGIVEKGRANVKFIAHSHGGHASIPFRNNPFARLARLVNSIERRPPFKKKLTKPVINMYKAMVPYMSFKYRFFLGNIWLFRPVLPFFMNRMGGQANALISSTCVFTQAEGSHGANVIPETATMTANMRFMVHEGLEKSFRKVSKLAYKNDIWMEMISGYDVCDTADTQCYAYKKVVSQIKDTFGDIPVIPYVMLAGTDARHYTKICKCVLRFVPLTLSESQQKSAHAVDENLSVNSLSRAVEYYIDLIRTYGDII